MISGQLAGATYGAQALPSDWREKLALPEKIMQLTEELHRLAGLFVG